MFHSEAIVVTGSLNKFSYLSDKDSEVTKVFLRELRQSNFW